MSRVLITTNDLPMNSSLPSASITWTAADSGNNHYYVDDGNSILLVMNGDASPKTATVVSVADKYNRTGDATMTVAARASNHDGLSVFSLPTGEIWRQAGTNQINVNISAATATQLAVVRVRRAG